LPLEQVEPELIITPSKSRPINAVSAAKPGIAKQEVLHSLGLVTPKKTVSGAACFRAASK
jgi:hypothetical protein